MTKLLALAGFAVAVATTAQAMPRAPIAHMDSLVTQVGEGCGIGMVMVNGQCVSRHELRVQRRMDRRDYYGANGTNDTGYTGTYYGANANTGNYQTTYGAGNCYRSWDQDARNFKYMACPTGAPGPYGEAYGAAYVDTPGVHAIMNARQTWGNGSWYPYAASSGIICTPGSNVTMGGQEYLCQ